MEIKDFVDEDNRTKMIIATPSGERKLDPIPWDQAVDMS
jgi:hypothetical protein